MGTAIGSEGAWGAVVAEPPLPLPPPEPPLPEPEPLPEPPPEPPEPVPEPPGLAPELLEPLPEEELAESVPDLLVAVLLREVG